MQIQHPLNLVVGANIRRMREQAGFAQDAFAMHIGMDRGYYGRIERGHHSLTLRMICKIADGLSIEPCELMPTLDEVRASTAIDPQAE